MAFYYIDESVLLGTKPLVDSIRHFIRESGTRVAYFPYVTFVSVISFNDIRFVSYIVLKFVGVSSKHLRVFLESLRKSSEIFGKCSGTSSVIRNNFGKSSENHQKRRHQHVYIIKRTLHGGLKI